MTKDDSAIKFNNVSKKFRLGQKLLLKEALLSIFKPSSNDYFWALKNVSFKINKGQTIGIIGKNGSGKSTILKLIAGIMVPSSGEVYVHGRIAPLIELGAGFHPELSGRENIFINGTILGLSEKEISDRFADIVEFAELTEFIDTPVKHYSSGMYLRLGFSVAVHTDPQILLIDEILAVGDESFQKKCFAKLAEFKKTGVTIVFISHDLDAINNFCDNTILVDKGEILKIGESRMITKNYTKKNGQQKA